MFRCLKLQFGITQPMLLLISFADMKDSKAGRNSPCGDGSSGAANADSKNSDSDGNFPVSAFYELDNRVFQDNWSIPYKVDEAFAREASQRCRD